MSESSANSSMMVSVAPTTTKKTPASKSTAVAHSNLPISGPRQVTRDQTVKTPVRLRGGTVPVRSARSSPHGSSPLRGQVQKGPVEDDSRQQRATATTKPAIKPPPGAL